MYSAGSPPTWRPTGIHTPSLGSTTGAGVGTRPVGGGRCSGCAGAVVTVAPFVVGSVPSTEPDVPCTSMRSGRPPVGGGLFVYHQRSIVLTNPFPPWSRNHSTDLTATESVPGRRRWLTYE